MSSNRVVPEQFAVRHTYTYLDIMFLTSSNCFLLTCTRSLPPANALETPCAPPMTNLPVQTLYYTILYFTILLCYFRLYYIISYYIILYYIRLYYFILYFIIFFVIYTIHMYTFTDTCVNVCLRSYMLKPNTLTHNVFIEQYVQLLYNCSILGTHFHKEGVNKKCHCVSFSFAFELDV